MPWPASSSAVSVAHSTGTLLHAREVRVVEEHRDAVEGAPEVELEAVAAGDLERREHRLERVLGRDPPVAAMGQAERPLSHRSGPGR